MKAAFVIGRRPWLQLLGPTMEAALAQGWEVECWHDYRQPRHGAKGYQFPSIDEVPPAAWRGATTQAFETSETLATWLSRADVDAVVSLRTSQLPVPAGPRAPVMVEQQHVLDTFVAQTAQQVLSRDVLAVASPWWINWAASWYALERQVDDPATFVRAATARAAMVGMPALDVARQIDPFEVRSRWGIPASQPVVVLFPFPAGVGHAAFWPKHVFGESRRWRQVAHIVRRGHLGYLPAVWRGWNDAHVVAALRRFCDRNDAFLLVKTRQKTPVPDYLAVAADLVLADEQVYPGTVFEALTIANLSIGHFTSAAIESVGLGVPHVCIPFAAEDYFPPAARLNIRSFRHFFTTAVGGPFHFPGASTVMTVPEILDRIGRLDLSSFALASDARRRYVETFLTHADGDAGRRLVAAMAAAVAARQSTES